MIGASGGAHRGRIIIVTGIIIIIVIIATATVTIIIVIIIIIIIITIIFIITLSWAIFVEFNCSLNNVYVEGSSIFFLTTGKCAPRSKIGGPV